MGVYEDNRGRGVTVMKWDTDLEQYVFDHDPGSVVYFNQESKVIRIHKDSRRICILDKDEIGFNDELTIHVESIHNMLKTGSRNLVRMFQPGWLITKQSCYLLLRCNVKLVTTSCSVVTMQDNNVIQCGHKNHFIGKDDNYITGLTGNKFNLNDGNQIKCRTDSIINVKDHNTIIVTNNIKTLNAECSNVIVCEDHCNIIVDCDNTILAGNHCIITCLGDNNFISCLDNCTIVCQDYSTITCSNSCFITAGLGTYTFMGLNCFLTQTTNGRVDKWSNEAIITDIYGYSSVTSERFNRQLALDFILIDTIGVPNDRGEMVQSWFQGQENPEPLVLDDWVYPVSYPEECKSTESWYTDEIFAEDYDACCPQSNTGGPAVSSPPQGGISTCIGGTGSIGGFPYATEPSVPMYDWSCSLDGAITLRNEAEVLMYQQKGITALNPFTTVSGFDYIETTNITNSKTSLTEDDCYCFPTCKCEGCSPELSELSTQDIWNQWTGRLGTHDTTEMHDRDDLFYLDGDVIRGKMDYLPVRYDDYLPNNIPEDGDFVEFISAQIHSPFNTDSFKMSVVININTRFIDPRTTRIDDDDTNDVTDAELRKSIGAGICVISHRVDDGIVDFDLLETYSCFASIDKYDDYIRTSESSFNYGNYYRDYQDLSTGGIWHGGGTGLDDNILRIPDETDPYWIGEDAVYDDGLYIRVSVCREGPYITFMTSQYGRKDDPLSLDPATGRKIYIDASHWPGMGNPGYVGLCTMGRADIAFRDICFQNNTDNIAEPAGPYDIPRLKDTVNNEWWVFDPVICDWSTYEGETLIPTPPFDYNPLVLLDDDDNLTKAWTWDDDVHEYIECTKVLIPEWDRYDHIREAMCEVGLEYAAANGWYSTHDEYKESIDSLSHCILDSSSMCSFDTTSGCPFDATSVCEVTKIEFARTIVMTGGTGGTGSAGSLTIPASHLFPPICC